MNRNSARKNIILITLLSIIVVIALGFSIITYTKGNVNKGDGIGSDSEAEDKSKDSTNKTNNNDSSIVVDNEDGGKSVNGKTTIGSGEISLVYTEASNGISLVNAMPISDTAGKVLSNDNEVFDFSIRSQLSGGANVQYEIAIIKDASSTLADSNVKLYLTKIVGNIEQVVSGPSAFIPIRNKSTLGSPAGSMIMSNPITVTSSSTDKYRLRMWVAEDTNIDIISRSYTVKVNVYGKAIS